MKSWTQFLYWCMFLYFCNPLLNFLFVVFWGHTGKHSGLNSDFVLLGELRKPFMQYAILGINLSSLCAKKVPYLLYCFSHPFFPIFRAFLMRKKKKRSIAQIECSFPFHWKNLDLLRRLCHYFKTWA